MIGLTERFRRLHPEARIGALAMRGVSNPPSSAFLDQRKVELEEALRRRFAAADRAALKADPVLAAYTAYYKRFDKTYHVLAQLESVALKGKAIPRVACLVEAMFMAELSGLLLTAGHDLDSVRGALVADAATGAETYGTLGGKEQALKPDDMYIRDDQGILSSVIHGPDFRSRIVPGTTRVLFTVYAPPGVSLPAVSAHLDALTRNVLVFSPDAQVESVGVYGPAETSEPG